ncbi:putative yippee-like protein [Dichanthelium oligosanthes]|uniref:Putative yippee-like protein n=1 Tax=Dichanthelium oligosanthes TaxID=888268 RepID=A0A1E5WL80_9POAL|nr:putative yippee-like protein [Dichanthelium oligosanthes]
MGLLFVQVLPRGDGDPGSPVAAVLQCRRCRLNAASMGAILSRDFHGQLGRAYLFDRVVNITLGPDEDRYLRSGVHTVNDIYCICCQEVLGWRYVSYNDIFFQRLMMIVSYFDTDYVRAFQWRNSQNKAIYGKFVEMSYSCPLLLWHEF